MYVPGVIPSATAYKFVDVQEIPQEPEDVQHQPEDASAAAAPAELPVDEEMVPVDDHDATVVSAEEVQAAEIPESADAETNFEVLPASTTCAFSPW